MTPNPAIRAQCVDYADRLFAAAKVADKKGDPFRANHARQYAREAQAWSMVGGDMQTAACWLRVHAPGFDDVLDSIARAPTAERRRARYSELLRQNQREAA